MVPNRYNIHARQIVGSCRSKKPDVRFKNQILSGDIFTPLVKKNQRLNEKKFKHIWWVYAMLQFTYKKPYYNSAPTVTLWDG